MKFYRSGCRAWSMILGSGLRNRGSVMSRADGGSEAAITLSIDLELAIGQQTPQKQEQLEAVTAGLLELLKRGSLPTTWGVSNPALSAATESIVAAEGGHEIAVLGDRIWLGNGTTRSRLNHEFERRFDGARRAGLEVSSLVLRNEVAETLDLNLLLEHGITAVRSPAAAASAQDTAPRSGPMRFGIWQVSRPVLVPTSGTWWQPEPWALQQRIRGALRSGPPLHLVLDASRMVEFADLGMLRASTVLRQLSQLQAAGRVRVATLGELAREDLTRRASTPSRSVLAA
jgi:hypothetical protein